MFFNSHSSIKFCIQQLQRSLPNVSDRILHRNLCDHFKATERHWGILIRQNTVISRNHMTPEIQLHLLTPECHLWTAKETDSPFRDPFWAIYWPGGQVLSRYILDNTYLVKDKIVLDFGCGSGACAIAAKLSGAKEVIANDIDEVACVATLLNANNNQVSLTTNSENLINYNGPWDCILIGDMFYDEEFANNLINWLQMLHRSGKTVLIGDAGRLSFTKIAQREKLIKLQSIQLPESVIAENNGLSLAGIWCL